MRVNAKTMHGQCFHVVSPLSRSVLFLTTFENTLGFLEVVSFAILFLRDTIFWSRVYHVNRELKHRSFWATDGNRKAAVIVFSAFSTTQMSWKALVFAFASWCYGQKIDTASQRRENSTFGWSPFSSKTPVLSIVIVILLLQTICWKNTYGSRFIFAFCQSRSFMGQGELVNRRNI